jgi:diguanylate cyclase (GGDEF)-like protein
MRMGRDKAFGAGEVRLIAQRRHALSDLPFVTGGTDSLPRRRLVPVGAILLTALILAGQIAASADTALREGMLIASIPVLDTLGVTYCVKAVRRSPYPRSWSLCAAGRGAALLATVGWAWYAYTGTGVWWWLWTVGRLAMFALVAAAALGSRLVEMRGRRRWAFLAETATVLAAGFMLVWYFVLDPAIGTTTGRQWVQVIGFSLGGLLFLLAASTLLLGGAMPRLIHPITPLVTGLVLYQISDAIWSSLIVRGDRVTDSAFACLMMVLSTLLLTLSPMLLVAGAARPGTRDRLAERPLWSAPLPVLALLLGGGLMLAVTVREDSLLPWGGLVIGLIVMTAAAMVRLTISVRASRDLVTSDALTGLANRTGLDTAVTAALRRDEPVAVLLLDLDGFKLVNDAYGHAAGDTMLVEFAHLLRSTINAGDVAARIGGDEFVVLLIGPAAPELAAQRILAAAAANPVRLGEDTLPVRASIGIAPGRPGDTTKEVLRRADVAMYQAKRAGTHSWVRHDPAMTDRRALDSALTEELEGAVARGEMHVLYQPIVDLTDERPVAVEALVRWHHPDRGLVSPAQFIPIAERSGVITSIGLFVLEEALRQAAGWPGLYVSVNLSPRQLQEPTLVDDVLAVLDRTGVDPNFLLLEVTESAIVDDKTGIEALRELRTHGIKIGIDDFGTGYSSLHYLTRLPVNLLKIDRSFVAELNGTPEGSAITDAVIRLAQVLHLVTVAEGIETQAQADELLALGCNRGQGFLYARPVPAEQISPLLDRGRLRSPT